MRTTARLTSSEIGYYLEGVLNKSFTIQKIIKYEPEID